MQQLIQNELNKIASREVNIQIHQVSPSEESVSVKYSNAHGQIKGCVCYFGEAESKDVEDIGEREVEENVQ